MPRHRLTYKYKFQSPPTCRGKIPPPHPAPPPSRCPILFKQDQCVWDTVSDTWRDIVGHPENLIDKKFALGCGLVATGNWPESITINCHFTPPISAGQFYFGVYINSAYCGAPPRKFNMAVRFADGIRMVVIDYNSNLTTMPVNQWVIGQQAYNSPLESFAMIFETYNQASTIISQIFIARCIPFTIE